MKLIEAMKKVKDLQRKAEDIRKKISVHCADLSFETPLYPDQRVQVRDWLQAHRDLLKEILHLRLSIQRTNLQTNVVIELGGVGVTKTIAEWIHRRRDLAKLDESAWNALTDRNLKEGVLQTSQGEKIEAKIRRHFDPAERDKMIDLFRSEPTTVDATLEVTNAITDLIE